MVFDLIKNNDMVILFFGFNPANDGHFRMNRGNYFTLIN